MISLIKDTNINMIWMSFVVIFWLQQTPSWCLRLTPTKRMTSHCCKTYLAMREKHHNYDPIVVTGLGIISPAGHDVYSYFHSIVEGQSTIGKVTKFDAVKFRCQIAAQVKGFHAADYYKSNKKEPNNLSSHYAVAAARQAISDAKLNLPEGSGCEASRVGVVIGSAFGGIIAMQDAAHALQFRGNLAVDKFTIPNMLGSTVASVVAKEFGVTGPSFVLESACASGTHAIGQAMRLLQNDDADIIIAGGTDAAITPLTFAGFCNLELMSTQNNAKPLSASRPFDSNRDGFVMGEGSGMLILEKFSYAIKRNARVYCELVGFGSSSDAHQNLLVPQPEGQGLQRAMKSCFRDANILPEEVQYINAHGISSLQGDIAEILAVKSVFGVHSKDLFISSTKGSTGHALGASGSFDAITCVKALEQGIIPPTMNYQHSEVDHDLNLIPRQAVIKSDLNIAISNSVGFAGHNGVLAFRKIT